VTETPGGRRLPHQRSMTFVWAALALIVMGVVTIIAVQANGSDNDAEVQDRPSEAATSSASPSPAPTVGSLTKFSGDASKTTTTFRAAGNWELKWRTQRDRQFAVELLEKDGTSRGQIVTAKKKTEGSTFVSEKGEFKLKVTAAREWSIEIVGRSPA
jgi:hypothetical protein